MAIVFFFVSVVLSCFPLLQSATDRNSSLPICPDTFSCPTFASFKFPFYNATEERCGLIKVNCTSKGGDIRIGVMSYKIYRKNDFGSSVSILNTTFKELVESESCKALMNNFTSPSPLLYSISIAPFITLFKCSKNLTYDHQMDAYFHQLNHNTHNTCKHHNFYYQYSINNATAPSDLPHTCQVIQLPVKEWWRLEHNRSNVTGIYSLLSSEFSVSFQLSPSCDECKKKGGQCDTHNKHFRCLHVKKDKQSLPLILGLTGLAIILSLSISIIIIWRCCKRKPFSYVSSKNKYLDHEDSRFFGVPVFSYDDLKDATQNFHPSQELGDGGFGAVYYGKLQDGREVAVKRLYDHNYKRVQHFMNEVEILTKLRHPNLVVLYGCTSKRSHELLLVYEYIPNGTVADHLHGEQANPSVLTWPMRMNIAIETARALVYLHASDIIHRDVKTNNILLDNNFSVKVADFGLSRVLPNNVTYVSTAPQGTPGYLDPQYHQRYQLTDKSDVYSFGVVLIELISSMVAVDLSRSEDEISLANLALNRIQGSEIEQLIDPVLLSDSDSETMNMITLVAELAFRCLQFDSEMRPTMNEVLDVLTDLQAEGSSDTNDDSSRDLKNVNPPPPSENSDAVVMLKDFLRSPISVTSEWKSDNSASTTISSNGEKLPVKNRISK